MAGIAASDSVATTGLPAEVPTGRGFRQWLDRKAWRDTIIVIPFIWLLLFFLLPFFIIFVISLGEATIAQPPVQFNAEWPYVSFDNYRRLFTVDRLFGALSQSRSLCRIRTCFVSSSAIRWRSRIARARGAPAKCSFSSVILPFWTSFLLRVYAWIGLLANNSWFNRGLTSIYNAPICFGASPRHPDDEHDFAVVLGITYSYLPFMVLPLYATLERSTSRSTRPRWIWLAALRGVQGLTFPLSVPGIIAGAILVFIPATGELVIPSLMGRADSPMIGRVINDEFGLNRDWPMASTIAVALLVACSSCRS